MNRISSFHVVYVAITILFLSRFCVFGREKSSTVHRWRRSTDDDSIRFQQQHKKPAHESNVDVKKENTSISKDHYKNDKIVFEPENIYNSKTTQRTLDSPSLIPSLFAIRSDSLIKSNETTHQYFGKANGEYEFSLTIRNGIRRIESGEYEDHNNQKVFVVRGFFEYITTDGILKVTAYVFDEFGYHEIPVSTDTDGIVDLYGPGQAHDCDFSKGVYCIDRKLLSLMVG